MSFINNLFGAIAGQSILRDTSMDFIPGNKDGVKQEIQIKGDSVAWLGMRSRLMQKYAYDFCYPVAAVCDRLAEYDLTGMVEILRSKGKGKENFATGSVATNLNKRFANPNPLQSWEQFRGQQTVYKKIFGFCPVLPLVPAGFTPDNCTAMINLPPWLFDVVGKSNYVASTSEELIDHYTLNILGKTLKFQPKELIILEDSFMQDEHTKFLLPQSRLVGLDMQISNICAALEADNVLLRKKGPLGFISQDPGAKDSVVGYLPMEDEEKEKLQAALQTYGLSWSQFQYVISQTPTRWNPMSYDTNQLGTKATVIAGIEGICSRYNYPYILYKESDATYANGAQAATAVYFNNVIPNANKDGGKYNKFFKAEENAIKIVFNFDNVVFLQDDVKTQAEARKAQNDAYLIEYENDLITLNQWREAMGYDTVPGDGDKYKSELTKAAEPMKLPAGITPPKETEEETTEEDEDITPED